MRESKTQRVRKTAGEGLSREITTERDISSVRDRENE